VNTKTRHTAFELLVKLAREFESADEEAEDDMMGGAAAGGAQLQVRAMMMCAVMDTCVQWTLRPLRTMSPSKQVHRGMDISMNFPR